MKGTGLQRLPNHRTIELASLAHRGRGTSSRTSEQVRKASQRRAEEGKAFAQERTTELRRRRVAAVERQYGEVLGVIRTEEFHFWFHNETGRTWDPVWEEWPAEMTFQAKWAVRSMDRRLDHEAELEKRRHRRPTNYLKRLRQMKSATPPWFDREEVRKLEAKRDRLNRERPEDAPWHIDHVVPLQHRWVCGLHVHTNMRVIPGRGNIAKSNHFDVDLFEEAAV